MQASRARTPSDRRRARSRLTGVAHPRNMQASRNRTSVALAGVAQPEANGRRAATRPTGVAQPRNQGTWFLVDGRQAGRRQDAAAQLVFSTYADHRHAVIAAGYHVPHHPATTPPTDRTDRTPAPPEPTATPLIPTGPFRLSTPADHADPTDARPRAISAPAFEIRSLARQPRDRLGFGQRRPRNGRTGNRRGNGSQRRDGSIRAGHNATYPRHPPAGEQLKH